MTWPRTRALRTFRPCEASTAEVMPPLAMIQAGGTSRRCTTRMSDSAIVWPISWKLRPSCSLTTSRLVNSSTSTPARMASAASVWAVRMWPLRAEGSSRAGTDISIQARLGRSRKASSWAEVRRTYDPATIKPPCCGYRQGKSGAWSRGAASMPPRTRTNEAAVRHRKRLPPSSALTIAATSTSRSR